MEKVFSAWNETKEFGSAGNSIIDEELLNKVGGGAEAGTLPSSGYICTLSGECNGTGKSCWPW